MRDNLLMMKGNDGRSKGSPGRVIPTLIAKDCVVRGTILQADAIRLEGTLDGDIVEAGSLVVGESGTLNGNVQARTVIIFGQVNGDVSATDFLEIKHSGSISGRLSTRTLSVERGAMYSGRIVMSHLPLNSG